MPERDDPTRSRGCEIVLQPGHHRSASREIDIERIEADEMNVAVIE
jgi:hypothetical protein